jgi:hypothetical protein
MVLVIGTQPGGTSAGRFSAGVTPVPAPPRLGASFGRVLPALTALVATAKAYDLPELLDVDFMVVGADLVLELPLLVPEEVVMPFR